MKITQLKYIHLFVIALITLVLSSCAINSNLMLKIPKDGELKPDSLKTTQEKYYRIVNADSIPMIPREAYKMGIDDKFTFTLSTNDGKNILEGLTGISQATGTTNLSEFLIRQDGFTSLPIVGEVRLVGLTVKGAEDSLKRMFSKHYLEPFIQIKVTNQRVIVFPGEGGAAKVIQLKNNNTTLMEVIAESGGITTRGRAKNVKLIRIENGKRVVYPIDLSTINGLMYADMYMQSNDYVYVEPNASIASETLKQTSPIVGILSSILIVFTIFNNLK